MSDTFSIVEPTEVPTEQFNTCETAVRKLLGTLGTNSSDDYYTAPNSRRPGRPW